MVQRRALLTGMLACLMAAVAFPATSAQWSYSDNPVAGLSCGQSAAELSHVTARLSSNFKLACVALTNETKNGHQRIDLARTRFSLESPPSNWYLDGVISLKGQAKLTGILDYNPGPAVSLSFGPNTDPIAPPKSAIAFYVSELKLPTDDEDHVPPQYHVPASLKATCWSAAAIIRVKGIDILLGDTDEAGAYPVQYMVVSTSNFKPHPCG